MLNQWLTYLDEQVGCGVYVWGAQGERACEIEDIKSWIFRRSQSNATAELAWKFFQKMEAALSRENLRFFDCSGLAMYFFQQLHGVCTNDTTAHGLWRGCTELKKSDLKPGDFVFRKTSGHMTHIGYVARNGEIVEARASGYGVEKRTLDQGGWTHFGRHKWLKEEIEKDETDAGQKTGKRTVRQWQNLLLRYDPDCLPKYGADGDYGPETDAAAGRLIHALQDLRKEHDYGR